MEINESIITVSRTGAEVEVWQKGEGPELVFLHGAGGQATWSSELEGLAKSFRVTVPMHPGFGKSGSADHIDGVLDSVLHTFDVLGELGISQPHLMGHSMGGMLATEMAAICPNEVASLSLVAPVGLWDDDHPLLDFFATVPADLVPHIFHDTSHPIAQAMMAEITDEDAIVELYVSYTKGLAAAGRLMWPIPDRGLKKRITRVTAPTQIIWGKQDGLVPVFYAEEFRKGIRDSRVEIVDEASHMILIERPERCVEIVTQFIDSIVSAPAK